MPDSQHGRDKGDFREWDEREMIPSSYPFEFKLVNKHTHALKYIQMCIICHDFTDMYVYTHACVAMSVCICVHMCAHTHFLETVM